MVQKKWHTQATDWNTYKKHRLIEGRRQGSETPRRKVVLRQLFGPATRCVPAPGANAGRICHVRHIPWINCIFQTMRHFPKLDFVLSPANFIPFHTNTVWMDHTGQCHTLEHTGFISIPLFEGDNQRWYCFEKCTKTLFENFSDGFFFFPFQSLAFAAN